MYQIIVRNKAGDELGEITQWTNLSFTENLNNYGVCRFLVPVTSPELSLISLRRNEVLVKRNGITVWAGELAARYGELAANSPDYIEIVSYTFMEMLNAMYTSTYVRYDNVDQGEILKELVDDFQAQTGANLGFTFNSYLTGTLRDREYTNQNIYEAYVNMTNVLGGPDLIFHQDKSIDIVPKRGVDRSKQIFFDWDVNLMRVRIEENFSNPCNQALMLGAGFGSEQLVLTVTDTPSRNIYGLRVQRSSEIDVSEVDTLTAKGQELVRINKQPLVKINMVQLPTTIPTFGSLQVGDTVSARIKHGIYNINNKYRIYGYEVQIGEVEQEEVSYLIANV